MWHDYKIVLKRKTVATHLQITFCFLLDDDDDTVFSHLYINTRKEQFQLQKLPNVLLQINVQISHRSVQMPIYYQLKRA